MMINELIKKAHQNACDKGFFDNPKNTGEMIALMHSELSEALEADRENRHCGELNALGLELLSTPNDAEFKENYKVLIKGSFEEEMADIVIRVFDMCGYKKIDLQYHIDAKMRYNSLRPNMHGKKY